MGIGLGLSVPASVSRAQESRGFLGVMVVPGEGDRGVVIREVAPGSPAEKAGLKSGDRVTKVGDHDAGDVDAFLKAVGSHKSGDKISLTVNRDGKDQKITATLGERTATARRPDQPGGGDTRRPEGPPMGTAQGPAYLGINIQPLTPELRKQSKLETQDGVVVAEVVPNSPAEKAGLKRDDVITAVGGHAVKAPEDLQVAVQQNGAGKELTLTVHRDGKDVTVKATPKAGAFGQFLTPGDQRFPSVDVASMMDESRRVRELERRVAELERRLQELDHRSGPSKK